MPDATEEPLDSVQVTYVDPSSGNICRRDVFCDTEDWKERHQSRFLISSDLVNLMNEAVDQRQARWDTRYRQLSKYRFGYECVLWALRQEVAKLASTLDSDAPEGATAGLTEEGDAVDDVCPVHFYRPERYLDMWTCERIDVAISEYTGLLNDEISLLNDRINEHGVSGWYDILKKVAGSDGGEADDEDDVPETPSMSPSSLVPNKLPPKKGIGIDILTVAKKVYEVTDDEDKYKLEDKMTGGSRTLHDKLWPSVDALEPEFEDYKQRDDQVQMDIGRRNDQIQSCEAKFTIVNKKLAEPPPVLGPESDSEISEDEPIDESAFWARVAELIKQLFDEWAEKARQAREQFEQAKRHADEWEGKWKTCDKNSGLGKLKAETEALETLVKKSQVILDKATAKAVKARGSCDLSLAQLSEVQGEVTDCQERIAVLPPPSPRSMQFQEMQEELKKLEQLYDRLKDKLKNPDQRIKSIRFQLRKLYDKFGWEWEFSDSEGEDEGNQPYWVRRKLAAEGMAKFNPNDFLNAERTYKSRRLKAKEQQLQEAREKTIFGQMVASRHMYSEHVQKLMRKETSVLGGGGVGGGGGGGSGGAERSLLAPFAADCGELRASDPVERAIDGFRTYLSTRTPVGAKPPSPRTAGGVAAIQASCSKLMRLHQSWSGCRQRLHASARCLPELLPDDAQLAEPKAALNSLVVKIWEQATTEMDMLEDAEWLDQEMQLVCAAVQDAIGGAIKCSGKVAPIAQALQHSIAFSALQSELADLAVERRAAIADLREVAGEEAIMQSCSTRLPSYCQGSLDDFGRSLEVSTSFREGSCGSRSPRPRTSPTSRGAALGPPPLPPGRPGGPPGLSSPAGASPGGRCNLSPLCGSAAGGDRVRGRHSKDSREDREVIDFGFRPDGVGEEPLENWSLFKVNKAVSGAGAGDGSVSPGGLLLGSGDKAARLPESKARLQRKLAAHCDFREYVSQHQQSSKEMWQSSSTPDLDSKFKRGPSLPQLVQPAAAATTAEGRGRNGNGRTAAGAQKSVKGSRSMASLVGGSRGVW